MLVYLAGPIRGLTYESATTWREHVQKVLESYGHTSISPMRGKSYLAGSGPLLGDSGRGSYEKWAMSSEQGIYGRDTFDITKCDLILAHLAGAADPSIGTCMEIQRGYDLSKYVLTTLTEGSVHDHIFVRRASSLVVPSLEEALAVLIVLGQPYETYRVHQRGFQ